MHFHRSPYPYDRKHTSQAALALPAAQAGFEAEQEYLHTLCLLSPEQQQRYKDRLQHLIRFLAVAAHDENTCVLSPLLRQAEFEAEQEYLHTLSFLSPEEQQRYKDRQQISLRAATIHDPTHAPLHVSVTG